jgi:Skp family chaperone for outer membrane proteins
MVESNWTIRRFEKQVAKRERKIQGLRDKMVAYEVKHREGKLTRAKLEQKKQHIEAKVRALSARVNTLRGKIGIERRRLEGKLDDE